MNQPALTPEQVQYLEAQQRIAVEQRNAKFKKIDEAGERDYGKKQWAVIAGTINKEAPALLEVLPELQNPQHVAATYAEDPKALKEITALKPMRAYDAAKEVDRRFSPHGATPAGNTLSWEMQDKHGIISKEEFLERGGDGLDDKTWNKNFDYHVLGVKRKAPR